MNSVFINLQLIIYYISIYVYKIYQITKIHKSSIYLSIYNAVILQSVCQDQSENKTHLIRLKKKHRLLKQVQTLLKHDE